MKSNLTEKLLSICGSADKTYGYTDSGNSITKLTEEQRVQVEAELIKHFDFDKIVWMQYPTGLTEDKTTPIVAKSIRISDSDNPTYKHKVGYIYTITFTPTIYEPEEMYQPVKDGCVFAPTTYNTKTFEPIQSITLTWSRELSQDTDTPQRTYEDDKQMIREMLEKVLENPEEYRPVGHIACLVRYATT